MNNFLSSTLLLTALTSSSGALATYSPPSPTLDTNSAYNPQEITEQEYDNAAGVNTFIDYENTDSELIKHFHSYQIKNIATSSPRLSSGFSSQDIELNFFNLNNNFPYGAAINLISGNIGNITGDFINNRITGINTYMAGGAIYNQSRNIQSIKGDFIGNYIRNTQSIFGGAIDNYDGTIGNITSNFIANYIISQGAFAQGGAIMNEGPGKIKAINGKFIGNYANSNKEIKSGNLLTVSGGAINNSKNGGTGVPTIDVINADFHNNHVAGKLDVYGGAISNQDGQIGSISGNFFGNYAQTSNATILAHGGAIYSNSSLNFVADARNNIFQGNYTLDNRGKIYNAIYLNGANLSLTFNTKHNGDFIFHDNIEGSNPYDINIIGDSSGKMILKNQVINAHNINISNTVLQFNQGSFGKGSFDNSPNLFLTDSIFDLNNGYLENINLKNYSTNNSYIHLDVNPDTMTSDSLNFNGNVVGTSKLIIYATSNTDIRGNGSIVFASSQNDTTGHEDSFEVFRVYKSPYLYDVEYIVHTNSDKQWGLVMNDISNPDKDVVPDPDPEYPEEPEYPDIPPRVLINPEIFAYSGLHSAAIEQTRNMVGNIRNKIAANKIYSNKCCGFYDYAYDGKPLKNLWITPVYLNSKIKSPVNLDVDIWGVEGGFDIQQNTNNKIGIFASYRQGEYNINSKDNYLYSENQSIAMYSKTNSRIDIDSYLGGLYYRYDKNSIWAFATIYGGVQQADIKTSDGIKTNSNGLQLGASTEIGKVLYLAKELTLEPSLGLSYTQIDFAQIDDIAGKTAKYNTIRQTEIEAATKLEKTYLLGFGSAKLNIKPGVIQPITTGDKVSITGLHNIETYDDKLLGRIEIGGEIALYNNIASSCFINYTFGSNYESTAFGIGINYSW